MRPLTPAGGQTITNSSSLRVTNAPAILTGHDIKIEFINTQTGIKFCPVHLMGLKIDYALKEWMLTAHCDSEATHETLEWVAVMIKEVWHADLTISSPHGPTLKYRFHDLHLSSHVMLDVDTGDGVVHQTIKFLSDRRQKL